MASVAMAGSYMDGMQVDVREAEQVSAEDLYQSMIQGSQNMPASLADFVVTDIYAIKGSCLYRNPCSAGSISSLSDLPSNTYGEYTLVFDVIYAQIVNLVPESYMTENIVERLTLALVYYQYITTHYACRQAPFGEFFMKKEAEAGEQSMQARILNLLNNDSMHVIRSTEIYALKAALENDFGGLIRKNGKFEFSVNN